MVKSTAGVESTDKIIIIERLPTETHNKNYIAYNLN